MPKGFLPYLDQDKILPDTNVLRIHWKAKKVVSTLGKEWLYDKLISSLPLPTLMRCMEPEPSLSLKEASDRLMHNIVYAINLAVKRDHISPYHWVYFPEEEYLLHRISFPKNFSRSMVPNGWSSITVEVSASKYRQVPTGKDLVAAVIDDLVRRIHRCQLGHHLVLVDRVDLLRDLAVLG